MEKKFSKSWIKSTHARKQRKYRANAPLSVKRKFMRSNLSKELREKSKMRTFGLIVGDKVTVTRGQHKGQSGKVDNVDVKKSKVFISGVEIIKKEGSKVQLFFHPSNLMITELNLDDKVRSERFNVKTKN